jgi:hypothetical protein
VLVVVATRLQRDAQSKKAYNKAQFSPYTLVWGQWEELSLMEPTQRAHATQFGGTDRTAAPLRHPWSRY